MSEGVVRGCTLEFEGVGVAVGAALVSGLLSLVGPYLASLTGTLAALALAGWVAARARSGRPSPSPWGWPCCLALGALAAGALLFLAPPSALVRFRALPLAGALVPLWWTSRRRVP